MKIGDILVVVKEFDFNGIYYKKGDKFKIISESGMRGWNIEDMSGNKIYETGLISDHFVSLSKIRDDKLKNLGI
jgi:hypothetical protein